MGWPFFFSFPKKHFILQPLGYPVYYTDGYTCECMSRNGSIDTIKGGDVR